MNQIKFIIILIIITIAGAGFYFAFNRQADLLSILPSKPDYDKIQEENATTSIEIIHPEFPENIGLAPYPDIPLASAPKEPISVKFLVDHRTALNGKTVIVRGIVTNVSFGEKACPPNTGFCGNPSVFLSDTEDKDRNPLYDLIVFVNEEEREQNYQIGKMTDIQVMIDGSNVNVASFKIYR